MAGRDENNGDSLINDVTLHGLPGTLLFTLRARAAETSRSDALLHDELAAAWYRRIVVPPAMQAMMEAAYTPVFQLGTAVRARLYDDMTANFLAARTQALVVELGAGLSTRYQRFARPGLQWVELDLAEAIAYRRQLEGETAVHHFLPTSMTDPHWPSALPAMPAADTLFLAEGVLFFLSPEEVAALFGLLARHFGGAGIGMDVLTQRFSRQARAAFAAADVPMRWLVADVQDVADLGVTIHQQWTVTHLHLSRWQALGFDPQKLLASAGNIVLSGTVDGDGNP
ncbi:MAG: class I SAM-dependent methyltransferase [Anaerolineales bacterium]|nr:class I SAM-dependent methyltransferase [Anaerolineales bacterium]